MKFNIRFTIQPYVFALLIVSCVVSCNSPTQDDAPPNIIVFLVDDMGPMDTSVPFLIDSSGNPKTHPLNHFYRTPNMEKLAAQGVRFTNFYAHSVCSPTRASILTGQNAARHGTTNWIRSESNNRTASGPSGWNWKGLTSSSVTLPRVLRQAGYQTIHIGKAHFGPFDSDGENPLNLGFDINIAGSSIGHPGSYYGMDGFGHINGQKERAVPDLAAYHGKEIFLTEALTLEAKAAISEAAKADKPFFLHMAHYAVHAPFHSDPRFADHYENSGKSEKAQAYATLIEGIDQSLGDILQHVKELGLGENTLILFLGDNGSDAPLPIVDGYSSSSPLKGKKGNHWEGGMRVPFIVSWISPNENQPNQVKTPIAKNEVQKQPGTILDLFPTLLSVAGSGLPNDHTIDGYELYDQLRGEQNPDRKEQFLNHFPHGDHRSNYFTSMVQSNWKVIYHYLIEKAPRYELYDLKQDPFETNNLTTSNPEQLNRMMQALRDQMVHYEARFPEKEGKPLELVMPK